VGHPREVAPNDAQQLVPDRGELHFHSSYVDVVILGGVVWRSGGCVDGGGEGEKTPTLMVRLLVVVGGGGGGGGPGEGASASRAGEEAGWLNRLPWTGSYPRAWWCTGWRCLWSATDCPGCAHNRSWAHGGSSHGSIGNYRRRKLFCFVSCLDSFLCRRGGSIRSSFAASVPGRGSIQDAMKGWQREQRAELSGRC